MGQQTALAGAEESEGGGGNMWGAEGEGLCFIHPSSAHGPPSLIVPRPSGVPESASDRDHPGLTQVQTLANVTIP